ncbi:MAG TPA: glutamate--tRNA ligase family protein, partial [Verrucomicrobiota bacterium]|nr:glutamate--tRNA ligase family protein [Verrucomicrobiota bacterium]
QEQGYAPEAVVNYLCLLGWSPKDNREIIPLHEIITKFDLPQIVRHNARFDMAKLQWMSGEYFRLMPNDRFYELATEALSKSGLNVRSLPGSYVRAAIDTCKGKLKTLSELPGYAGFYFTEEVTYDPDAAARLFTPQNIGRLARLREAFAGLASFTAPNLESCLKTMAAQLGVKPAELVHPLRLACTGKTIGPSLYHLIEILGRDRVLARLDRALAWCETRQNRGT